MSEPAFSVIDAAEGLCRRPTRTPPLDGAVPVRVAQGCQPMLEGNAFGFQIELTRPLELRARLGRVHAEWPSAEEVARLCRAAAPRLVARGLVDAEWRFATRAVSTSGRRARVWTGLFVRPAPDVCLRVSSCANRRNRLVSIAEEWLEDSDRFVPLVLEVTLDGAKSATLSGEIATIAPFAPGASIARCTLKSAPEIARAHADFYDKSYFQTKKSKVDAKYRRLLKRTPEANGAGTECRVVSAGPVQLEVALGAVPRVVFKNAVPFRARFDGHTLTVDKDERALREGAAQVERTFGEACGDAFAHAHRGALLYLTKYFTPHPPGEPHFFVKPWAFTVTPPGWSTLVEGIGGPGYDVLRGVVATDAFHATPAVFQLHDTGRWIEVPRGAPLLQAIPFPRALARRAYREVQLP
jgi:hypothetical protein